MSAGTVCRHVFWFINVLCMIVGLVTALICAIFMDSIHTVHLLYCILGFVVGLLTFLLALVGCRAIKPESAVLMWIYVSLLTILFGIQLYITTHYHTCSVVNQAIEEVKTLWAKELKNVGAMSTIEKEFRCCGLHSYKDYLDAQLAIPSSCYDNNSAVVVYYVDGCLEKVEFAARRGADGLKIISTILTAVQMLALTCATLLAVLFHRNFEYNTI